MPEVIDMGIGYPPGGVPGNRMVPNGQLVERKPSDRAFFAVGHPSRPNEMSRRAGKSLPLPHSSGQQIDPEMPAK